MTTCAAYDVEKMSDNEILEQLANMGVNANIDTFKENAIKIGSPNGLASVWSESASEFFYKAARKLWEIHLSDIKCPELLADFASEVIAKYNENAETLDRTILLDIYEKMKKLYSDLLENDGNPDIGLFDKVNSDELDGELEVFVLDLPLELSRFGLVDEAVNIGRRFANFSENQEVLLRDIGCILAKAGRKEDALKQIKINLLRFPTDIWVVINAGDAMQSLEDLKAAEEYFLKAQRMAVEEDVKVAVLERLIHLHRMTGNEEKARKCEDELAELTEIPEEPIRAEKRPSRNAPCPCGSGKKYKKCCMNKSL